MSIHLWNKYTNAGSAVEAYGASAWPYFPANFTFSPWLPVRGCPEILCLPFTEAATGASVNPVGQSQETEVGGTQAVAEWGWTDNLKESSNSIFLYWKIQGNRYTSVWPTLSKAERNSSDFLLCALEN